jgi:hypothetical protein
VIYQGVELPELREMMGLKPSTDKKIARRKEKRAREREEDKQNEIDQ